MQFDVLVIKGRMEHHTTGGRGENPRGGGSGRVGGGGGPVAQCWDHWIVLISIPSWAISHSGLKNQGK